MPCAFHRFKVDSFKARVAEMRQVFVERLDMRASDLSIASYRAFTRQIHHMAELLPLPSVGVQSEHTVIRSSHSELPILALATCTSACSVSWSQGRHLQALFASMWLNSGAYVHMFSHVCVLLDLCRKHTSSRELNTITAGTNQLT